VAGQRRCGVATVMMAAEVDPAPTVDWLGAFE